MKNKREKKNISKYIYFIRSFWLLFFSGLFFLVIIFSSAALGYLGDMPDLQQLENPKTNLATQIISKLSPICLSGNNIALQQEETKASLSKMA